MVPTTSTGVSLIDFDDMEGVGVPVINVTANADVDQVFNELYNGEVLPSLEEVAFTCYVHTSCNCFIFFRCWMGWVWVQMVHQFLHLINSPWSHILSKDDHVKTISAVILNLWPALPMTRKFPKCHSQNYNCFKCTVLQQCCCS